MKKHRRISIAIQDEVRYDVELDSAVKRDVKENRADIEDMLVAIGIDQDDASKVLTIISSDNNIVVNVDADNEAPVSPIPEEGMNKEQKGLKYLLKCMCIR